MSMAMVFIQPDQVLQAPGRFINCFLEGCAMMMPDIFNRLENLFVVHDSMRLGNPIAGLSEGEPPIETDADEPSASSLPPLPPLEAEPAARETDAVLGKELGERLEAALDTLSAEHRVVIGLFAVDDLGHAEIAEILGIPEGTVWSRLHRARKQLQQRLDR